LQSTTGTKRGKEDAAWKRPEEALFYRLSEPDQQAITEANGRSQENRRAKAARLEDVRRAGQENHNSKRKEANTFWRNW